MMEAILSLNNKVTQFGEKSSYSLLLLLWSTVLEEVMLEKCNQKNSLWINSRSAQEVYAGFQV